MGFEKYLLKDIASVQTGPFGSQLHKKDYIEDGTPIITVEHLGDNKILHRNMPGVKDEDVIRLSKYNLLTNDIVFSRVGSVDRRALVSEQENGWLFSGRCLRVRTESELVNPIYLSYYFGLPQFKEYIRNIAVGATMPSINTKILSNIEVTLPNIDRQNQIADILHTIDGKIWMNESIADKLEQLAQNLFKRWFVDFEFPNENGEPYKTSGGEMVESELGMIPVGWEVKSLDQIANFTNGLAMQRFRPSDGEESLPVLKIKELRQGQTDVNSDRCSMNIKDRVKIFDGDVIFSWSATLLVTLWHGGNAGLNQHLFKITSEEYPKWFYYYWTKNHLERFIAIASDKATTMGHINRSHLSESKVVIPTTKQLNTFSKYFSPLVDQIINKGLEVVQLEELRDTLLPKLLSGEIELPDEIKVADDIPIP